MKPRPLSSGSAAFHDYLYRVWSEDDTAAGSGSFRRRVMGDWDVYSSGSSPVYKEPVYYKGQELDFVWVDEVSSVPYPLSNVKEEKKETKPKRALIF